MLIPVCISNISEFYWILPTALMLKLFDNLLLIGGILLLTGLLILAEHKLIAKVFYRLPD